MTKAKFRLKLILLLVAVAIVPGPAPARAAREAAIRATFDVTYVFAQQITFKLDAKADARITRATVFFQSDRSALQQAEATFTPDTSVDIQLTRELRGGAIPPFSRVTYWWEIVDENNVKETTPRTTFDYFDNRYDWQKVTDGGVTLRWVVGDAAFAESILQTALGALPGISGELGVRPPSNIDIYVYPSREDLIGALRLGGRDWAGGQARPELGVVLVDVPATPDASVEMRRVIPHEITHLLVYAATQPNYARVPAWLDEGLATANEASPDPALKVALDAAVSSGQLITFESLCAPFSAKASEALQAYAQSGSLIQFIRDRYGGRGIRSLLTVYRENAACVPGVERALGVTLPALEGEWRTRSAPGAQATRAVVETSAPWLALIAVIGLALLPILMAPIRSNARLAKDRKP